VARRNSQLRRVLTLGGQLPTPVGGLLVGSLVVTVASTAWWPLHGWLALRVPGGLFGAEPLWQPWRLLTWPLPQGPLPGSLVTLLFAGLTLAWVGRQLGGAWGPDRLLIRLVIIVAGAGALTMLLLAPFEWDQGFSGLWPVVNALLFAWGLTFPRLTVSWFGALEMRGSTVAAVVAWGTLGWALLLGPESLPLVARPAAFLPHLAALFIAWLLVGGGPRRALTRLQTWLDQRRLKRKLGRFEVIDTRRPPGGWVN
jgi:hypothetical protein